MAADPKNKYGIASVPRKTPNGGIANGKLIARVGLLEYLKLTPTAGSGAKFSEPFSKRSHTRTLYPGATPITVAAATGVVTTIGRVQSLNAGRSWTLVIGGKAFGIRVLDLRAEDLEEFLKASTAILSGDYFMTDDGGKYTITKGNPPTVLGAAGNDTTVGGASSAPPDAGSVLIS